MSTLISCRQINKTYGPQTLFADLDLNISEGERLALIGANGAGKSTLLKILAELDTPDQGEVIRRNGLRMAYVPQIATFEAGHSIFSIVAASAQKANVPDPEAAAHIALGRAGFDDTDAEAVTLSGGRQKRLTLARALVTEPSLLLADEPTGNLDSARSEDIMRLLVRLNEERGITIVMVTHEPEMAAFAKRIVEFKDGQILDDRPTERMAS